MLTFCLPPGTPLIRPRAKAPACSHRAWRPRVSTPSACTSPPTRTSPTTEETFAKDAGRDLFFTGLDAAGAIDLLSTPLGELEARDDRFIAAERLQFFPSLDATRALLAFIARFEGHTGPEPPLTDRVARRKAVETLGRYGGRFAPDDVRETLTGLLQDAEPLMVEVAAWAIAEASLADERAMQQIALVLDRDEVSRRAIVHALLRARYVPALGRMRALVDDEDVTVASAARAAVCVLDGDCAGMGGVVEALKSNVLNVRRCAIEDVTLAKYAPALDKVAVAPNSLVLRARTLRVLLDGDGEVGEDALRVVDKVIWDHPYDLDLLGEVKETKKARDLSRNVRQLYKNDALYPYLAARTIAEDYLRNAEGEGGAAVLKSFEDLPYFDYFGAYHVFKTLGWLKHTAAAELLRENAENLPPRFFNHQLAAVLALSEINDPETVRIATKVATTTQVWELKYACLMACERVGSTELRVVLKDDNDWLVRARARSSLGFDCLRSDLGA